MAADLVKVFEISRWSNGLLADELLNLLVGVVALVGSATVLLLVWRRSKAFPWRQLIPTLFILAWAVVWLTMSDFPRTYQHIDFLAESYEKGRYQVAEGVVTVLRQQPAHGHASGDRIVVGGSSFEVNYFHATPAYRQTIAHGGVLRAGAYARLSHVDGEIIRVEVRKQ